VFLLETCRNLSQPSEPVGPLRVYWHMLCFELSCARAVSLGADSNRILANVSRIKQYLDVGATYRRLPFSEQERYHDREIASN